MSQLCPTGSVTLKAEGNQLCGKWGRCVFLAEENQLCGKWGRCVFLDQADINSRGKQLLWHSK